MTAPINPAAALFTPGPWAWAPSFEFGDMTGDLFGLGGEQVISSASYEGMWLSAYDKQRDAANARLIAASPELYATLEHIRELLVAYGPRYIEKAVRLSDAALAKARGQ